MLPNTTYAMMNVTSRGSSSIQFFTTGTVPANLSFPSFTVRKPPGPGSDLLQGLVFHMDINGGPTFVSTVATDLQGHVAWYYDPVAAGSFGGGQATSVTPAGTVLILGNPVAGLSVPNYDTLREVDLAGDTFREVSMEAINAQLMARGEQAMLGISHEAVRLPNGNTAIFGTIQRTINLNGTPTIYVADLVVVLDQNFQVAWTWNPFNFLDVNRLPTLGDTDGQGNVDWTHANSIAWSPADGNLIVSLRSQDWVVKLSYTNGTGDGHVVWRLGADGDFTINSSDPYPWFSHQHDVSYSDNTTLTLFDNGNTRIQGDPTGHSRGQVLTLNEQTRTASLVLNADLGNYSGALGTAQKLPNGNYSFTSGFLGSFSNAFGQTIEVRPDGTLAYVIEAGSAWEYRSNRLGTLYGLSTSEAAPTTTTLTSSGNTTNLGQAVTFTATVTPASSGTNAPTGTATFRDGNTVLGSGALDGNEVATFTTTALPAGSQSVTVTYDGDANFTASSSAPVNQTVNPLATATTVAGFPNPSALGQPVTLTAVVTPSTAGPFTAGGTVTFYDGATQLGDPVAVVGGTASETTAALSVGAHSIKAVYTGDANFVGSTSTALTHVVALPTTTVSLTNSPPALTVGQAVTFTATVTPTSGSGTPTGTVTFQEGATVLATVSLNGGVATFGTTSLAAGTHSISATYNGDANYTASTSPAVTETVNKAVTTATLVSAPNPSVLSQAVTFTTTISPFTAGPFTAGGTVTFFDGGTPLGAPVSVVGGTAALTTTSLAAGTHPVTAVYTGDANFAGSSSTVGNQVVNSGSTSVVVSLTNSPSNSTLGQAVTFTATVTPTSGGTPTGTVTFLADGSTPLGAVSLVQGTATLTSGALPAGTHTITAGYGGDANFAAGTSAPSTQVVTPASTTTALTGGGNPTRSGQSLTFTATVTGSAAGTSFAPSGSVTFFDGATPLGQAVALSNGRAVWSTSTLSLGVHSITAKYSGDANFGGSTSNAQAQVALAGLFFALGGAHDQVQVRRISDGSLVVQFAPFVAPYNDGVTVAMADVNGDGYEDLIVGSAAGSSHVKVYDGKALANGTLTAATAESHLITEFMGFDPKYHVGVHVAAGYLDGSTHADIILGTTCGNPQVKVVNSAGIGTGGFDALHVDANLLATWFAYGQGVNMGVTVAAGDVEGTGIPDVVTGSTAGNPNVKVFRGKPIHDRTFNGANPDANLVASFFPYATGQGLGVNVAVGDVNGDHFADIITAPTVSNPDVRVYDGQAAANGSLTTSTLAAHLLDEFYAFDPKYSSGVTLAAADFTGTGHASLLTAASNSPHYRLVDGLNSKGTLPPSLKGIDAVLSGFTGGLNVGA
jgi:hypothetical protein